MFMQIKEESSSWSFLWPFLCSKESKTYTGEKRVSLKMVLGKHTGDWSYIPLGLYQNKIKMDQRLRYKTGNFKAAGRYSRGITGSNKHGQRFLNRAPQHRKYRESINGIISNVKALISKGNNPECRDVYRMGEIFCQPLLTPRIYNELKNLTPKNQIAQSLSGQMNWTHTSQKQ